MPFWVPLPLENCLLKVLGDTSMRLAPVAAALQAYKPVFHHALAPAAYG